MINLNARIKITQQEIGIYLKVINLDNPNTSVTQKAQLISDTFGVECTEEDINEYYNKDILTDTIGNINYPTIDDIEPDYEWLNDVARAR